MLQSTVNRNFATGLIGEIVRDGPVRAKPARIISAGTTAPNRVGRAFVAAADATPTGTTMAAFDKQATIGDTSGKFLGILAIPKHYTLYGTNSPLPGEQGGPLSPTMDLPQGSEGEFVDMGTLLLEVTNGNDTAQAVPYATGVFFCNAAGAAATGFVVTTAADLGRLYVFPGTADQTTVPARFTPIAVAFVANALPSTAAGAVAQTIVQLTR